MSHVVDSPTVGRALIGASAVLAASLVALVVLSPSAAELLAAFLGGALAVFLVAVLVALLAGRWLRTRYEELGRGLSALGAPLGSVLAPGVDAADASNGGAEGAGDDGRAEGNDAAEATTGLVGDAVDDTTDLVRSLTPDEE